MNESREFPLVDRLRAFGDRPVDPALQSAHLASMAHVAPPTRRRIVPRLRVAAVAMLAVLVMSTGLAAANVDAGPLSDVGERLAGALGVDITNGTEKHGTDRYYGADCLPIADGKGAINHGQYLKWVRENRPDQLDAAKASKCGKPLSADQNPDSDQPDNDAGDGD